MFYQCPEFKSIFDSMPRSLAEYEEIRGILTGFELVDSYCVVNFQFGAFALPKELEPRLRELIGRKIAILKLEGFRIRCLENRDA